MITNRRSYYRILHIQPDAPLAVIKASYRSLMITLKNHPDLGGNHETAVLINQAYTVLSDSKKRAAYDQYLQTRDPSRSASLNASDNKTHKHTWQREQHSRAHKAQCDFCHTKIESPALIRCPKCQSPVKPIAYKRNDRKELFGRRLVPRISKTELVTFSPGFGQPDSRAMLNDISTHGVQINTLTSAEAGQVFRIQALAFEALATVVSCRIIGLQYTIHAQLLSVIFDNHLGVFVSAKA